MMYMTEESRRAAASRGLGRRRWRRSRFAMLATFYLGVLPTRVLDYALQSIQTIF